MSVAFDLTTLILAFAIIRDLTNQRMAALLGALLYGVFPMQVIYSHFMRTYTLSNLLCALVIWLSLRALKHRHWWLFVITGAAAGLAAATRYPASLVLSVPCALVLFQGHPTKGPWRQHLGKAFVYLLSGPLWLLTSGFVLGLL
jgi:4-amino-4-deoxy-L-arabinose transferase-like glycosyltransferase